MNFFIRLKIFSFLAESILFVRFCGVTPKPAFFRAGPGVPPTENTKSIKITFVHEACSPPMMSEDAGTFGVLTGKIGVEGRDLEAKNLSGFSGLIR